jgi:K+ transporter
MLSLQKQIEEHEVELTQMIDALTDDQMESLRTTVEYLWEKSYNKTVFNKSTLLTLMKKQLNFRLKDIQWGRSEGRTEGRTEERAKRTAKEVSVFQLMLQEGKINREQMEYFLRQMEKEDEKSHSLPLSA